VAATHLLEVVQKELLAWTYLFVLSNKAFKFMCVKNKQISCNR